jgi:hypothetical protein
MDGGGEMVLEQSQSCCPLLSSGTGALQSMQSQPTFKHGLQRTLDLPHAFLAVKPLIRRADLASASAPVQLYMLRGSCPGAGSTQASTSIPSATPATTTIAIHIVLIDRNTTSASPII